MQNDKTKDQAPELIMQPDAPAEGLASGDEPAQALQQILDCSRNISCGGETVKKRKRFEEMKPAKRPSFFKSVPFRFGAVILAAFTLLCLFYNFARAQGHTLHTMGLIGGTGLLQSLPMYGREEMTFYVLEAIALEQDRFKNVIALSNASQVSRVRGGDVHNYLLAYAYSHLGDYQKAIEHQKLAQAGYSGSGFRMTADLALMQEEAGEYQDALNSYIGAEKRLNRGIEPYLFPNEQWSKEEWGRFHPITKGRAFFLHGLNRQSYPAAALMDNNISHCYVQLNNPTAGIEYANKALATDAECIPAYKNKALAELQLGQVDNALADANKALQLDKNYIAGLLARSEIYNRLGDKSRSESDRQLANSLKQELPRTPS
jgi:tetratricopeptide (TPR) repeat protein